MNKTKTKVKIILTGIFLVGAIINGIIITLYNVDKSTSINEVSQEFLKTKSIINNLNEEISNSDSLTRFLEKSADSGFVENSRVLYFSQADSLAQVR